ETVADIQALGRVALAIQTDLGKAEEAVTLIDESINHFGTVALLINNAAVWPTSYVKEMSLKEWNETLDVNLTSVFLTSQAFANHCLTRDKKGKSINMTSQSAFQGSTTSHDHYTA